MFGLNTSHITWCSLCIDSPNNIDSCDQYNVFPGICECQFLSEQESEILSVSENTRRRKCHVFEIFDTAEHSTANNVIVLCRIHKQQAGSLRGHAPGSECSGFIFSPHLPKVVAASSAKHTEPSGRCREAATDEQPPLNYCA